MSADGSIEYDPYEEQFKAIRKHNATIQGCDPKLKEEGVITSWNTGGIFVRYGSQVTSQRTNREDLEYIY